MESVYLTSREAAHRLGICPRTLLRAVRRGEVAPARRTPGGHCRFRIADVEAYAQHLAVRHTTLTTQTRA